MENQNTSNSKLLWVIIIVLAVILIGGGILAWWLISSAQKSVSTNNQPSPAVTITIATPTAVVTLTPTVAPTPLSSFASEVVDDFTKYTLGTIPDASLDYEAAKLLMTSTYRSQFTDDSFIPITYCIQQGPDSIQILAETIMGDAMSVEVQGSWGGSDGTTWDFILVNDGSGWKIDQIICSLG